MILLLIMATITLAPIEEAVRFHNLKTPVGSALRSAEWERVALGLRNSAQFTAAVEEIRVVSQIQRDIGRILSHHRDPETGILTDRSKFIGDLTGLADSLGLRPTDPDKRGTIEDIGAERRAALIYDMQIGQAYGYANWKGGQDEDSLDAAPAQELVRIRDSRIKRPWIQTWRAAGGTVYPGTPNGGPLQEGVEGRCIALKTDPIWSAISRFGNPWPPYDFGSGIWVEDVLRSEATELGILEPGQHVAPDTTSDIDQNLSANVSAWTEQERGQLKSWFGDQVEFKDEKAIWQGSLIKKYVARALETAAPQKSIPLGGASPKALALAQDAGLEITGKRLLLEADTVRKTWRDHHLRERRSGQRPLMPLDYELLPHVWREPDAVFPGHSQGSLRFEKELLGRAVLVVWDTRGQAVRLKSLYVKAPAE